MKKINFYVSMERCLYVEKIKKVFILASHTGDGELGCGGVISK